MARELSPVATAWFVLADARTAVFQRPVHQGGSLISWFLWQNSVLKMFLLLPERYVSMDAAVVDILVPAATP